jgi:hypothetical protein
MTPECVKALHETLPPPPVRLLVRSLPRHFGRFLCTRLFGTVLVVTGSVLSSLALFVSLLLRLTKRSYSLDYLREHEWVLTTDPSPEQPSSWVPASLPREDEAAPIPVGPRSTSIPAHKEKSIRQRRITTAANQSVRHPLRQTQTQSWRCCRCEAVWLSSRYTACLDDELVRCPSCTSFPSLIDPRFMKEELAREQFNRGASCLLDEILGVRCRHVVRDCDID